MKGDLELASDIMNKTNWQIIYKETSWLTVAKGQSWLENYSRSWSKRTAQEEAEKKK